MDELDRAREALTFIPASCERDTWWRILAAIKSEFGEGGRDIADEWSQSAPDSYRASDFASVWKSIHEGGAITIATLYGMARESGWTPQHNGQRTGPSPEDLAKREAARKAEAERLGARHAAAAAKAQQAWAAGTRGAHPYLERKGVTSTGTMKIIRVEQLAGILGYEPASDGVKLQGWILMLPIKVDGALSSLELIDEAGRKSALAGGRKSGGYWSPAKLPEGDGEGITLQVAEGAADALSGFEASKHPTIAALSSHNLKPAALAMRARYPKARIAILADVGNGEDKAHEAAAAVGGLVATPDFGTERPEGAKDWNDLHKFKGLPAVREGLERAQPPRTLSVPQPAPGNRSGAILAARGEPKPLTVAIKSEPYPEDALPPTIRAAVSEVQRFAKAPFPLVAGTALAAVSLVGQSLADVRRMRGLEGPCSLYLLTIADSGERKSTCDSHFTRAIKEWLAGRLFHEQPAIAKAAAEFQAWEMECQGLKDSIRSNRRAGDNVAVEQDKAALVELMSKRPPPHKFPRLMRGEDTPEKLALALMNEWPSCGIISSEGGVILGGHGMGSDSLLRTLSQYNVFWENGDLSRGRASVQSVEVSGARLTVSLQIQESMLRAFFERSQGLARGSGFLARFLLTWPESTIGKRMISEPPTWEAMGAFDRRITELLNIPVSLNERGGITPRMLEMEPDAQRAWAAFHDAIEGQLVSSGGLFDVKDIASKIADNAARLAALFHIFEVGPHGSIGLGAMQSAIRIAAWHLNEARRFLGGVEIPAELVNASKLDGWLHEYCARGKGRDPAGVQLAANEVMATTVYQFGPHGLRDKATVAAAIGELEEQSRAWMETRGRAKVIVIHPRLLEAA